MPDPCQSRNARGDPCRAKPLRGETLCFMHDPGHREDVAQARRLGGKRRRREKTVRAAFGIEQIHDLEGMRRVLEVVVLDTLALENSVARSRAIAYLIQVILRWHELADLGARLRLLEQFTLPRQLADD